MTKQIEIPIKLENEIKIVKGQIFGNYNDNSIPILCLHGYLDNSNSFRPLAKYICRKNKYYMIAIDLLGQGLSSHLKDPLLYNFKTFVYSIRCVVNYLNLRNYIFMGHSMGCTLALSYLAVFPDEILSLVLLDFAFDLSISNDSLAECWKQGIETILDQQTNKQTINSDKRSELTYDAALDRLMNRNRHVDEEAAKILLERSLIFKNDKLEFSRDLGIPIHFPIKYHYMEFSTLRSSVVKNIKSPILNIYAYPYPYGENTFNTIMKIIQEITDNAKSNLEHVKFEKGGHHFHMLESEECSKTILKFLDANINNFNLKYTSNLTSPKL